MTQAAASIRTASTGRPSRWMLARQSFVSLAVVLCCYWMYRFLAVPLIEPNADERVSVSTSEERLGAARETLTVRQRELAQYFAPDDWEAKDPAIWQSGQMRLLFGTLAPQQDGTVELRPCTVMFFPKSAAGSSAVRPIIMRAVEGAVVEFDERIDLRSVDLNRQRFRGGKLRGEIRIVQNESAPGQGDDLEITTRDVQLSSERAWTPEPVHFRMGRSHGSGRDLEIELGSTEPNAAPGAMRGLTVQSLELKREVRMRLEMGTGPLVAGEQAPGLQNPAAPPAPRQTEPPIEITCEGSFDFDMQDYAASFHLNVDVLRINPMGESDQLNCQLLTVYFGRPGEPDPHAASPSSAGTPRSAASQVRLIEARGNPVTMRSPSQGMYARCNGVDYIPGATGEPGTLVAFGTGVIHGNLPNDPAGKYNASWARELRFEPDGSLYRATLQGATKINIGQMGEITADEVFAWLSKKPQPTPQVAHQARFQPVAHQVPPAGPPNSNAWQIERIQARRYQTAAAQSVGDVVIDSAQLHAVANLLEATVMRQPAGGSPSAAAGNVAAQQPGQAKRPPQNPSEKFEVTGRTVQIQLVPRGEELAIASATIDQNAELQQWETSTDLKKRLLMVRGDRLHVTDAHTEATRVTINGQPGFVEAQGMSLWGATIELEKKTNRLWITGPGRLMLPVTQDMDGKPLPRPQQLTVDWKTGMNFQSITAVFTGTVVARSSQQVVNTEALEATLTRPVDFSNPNVGVPDTPGERLDLAALKTRGWTVLEGRQLDEQGQQTSFSQMGVNDLSIERGSGAISGVGPGWVKHVSQGAPQVLDLPGQRPPGAAPPPVDDKKKLTYLYVTFRQGLTGNLNRREVKFFDQTKTIYGPVADWGDQLDDKDLAGLGATGMTLEASSLEVREMDSRPGTKRGYFELDATGSIFAEGQRFTAQGERLTYAEQSDQLALHGDPAELFRENPNDGKRTEYRAKLVQYWFKDQHVKINGASLLSLPLSSPGPAKTPAATPAAAPTAAAPAAAPPAINPLPPGANSLSPR